MENNDLITKAILYARTHMASPELSVQDVADAAGFSLDYFNRMFLTHTGFTVMAYVNYIRLKKALLLLQNTDKTLLEIALDIGYNSQEGFSKAFQKKYNITPSEYRKQKKNQIIRISDLVDTTIATRFIHDNPDFTLVDSNEVIEYLLDIDSVRYARLCSEIKHMGIAIAAQGNDFKRGFIGIHALPMKPCVLEMVTDDIELLAEWLKRFDGNRSFCCNQSEEEVLTYLSAHAVDIRVKCRPHAVYQGTKLTYSLPESVQIKRLDTSDIFQIQKWAKGKIDSYIRCLLKPEYYQDECVLEYGVFENGELIAIAGCGIDEVQGLYLNDCCTIRFTDGKEQKELYRPIYAAVTELLWQNGIIPYDEIQFGEYAKEHGDFSSVDLGYRIVNRKYDVL